MAYSRNTLSIRRLIHYPFCVLVSLWLLTACSSSRKAFHKSGLNTIEILAVNDIHAAIDHFPRLGFIVDSLRTLYPDMLLVSGGDNQTGNPVNDQYPQRGMPVIELMNALQFDISAVGNHEFDVKPEAWAYILKQAQLDFIGANIQSNDPIRYPIKPYKTITMPKGDKIIFLSVLDINEHGLPATHPDNLHDFTFDDPFQTAHKYLYLKDSCDRLIFLNHFGYENDSILAQQLPAGTTDLIIGGHSHTKIDTIHLVNDILITQAESKLNYASFIQLSTLADGSTKKTMELLSIGRQGNERADIRAMVDSFNDNPVLNTPLAFTDDELIGSEMVGYLMVDALQASTGADIALLNLGGVRTKHLNKGAITVKDVYLMDPFGNQITLFRLSGKELLALLTSAYYRDHQKPVIPAGLKLYYFIDDEQLTDIQIFTPEGEPLDMDAVYTIAMNSYMAAVYEFAHAEPARMLPEKTAESMMKYLRNLQQLPSYRTEKRIEVKRIQKP